MFQLTYSTLRRLLKGKPQINEVGIGEKEYKEDRQKERSLLMLLNKSSFRWRRRARPLNLSDDSGLITCPVM